MSADVRKRTLSATEIEGEQGDSFVAEKRTSAVKLAEAEIEAVYQVEKQIDGMLSSPSA